MATEFSFKEENRKRNRLLMRQMVKNPSLIFGLLVLFSLIVIVLVGQRWGSYDPYLVAQSSRPYYDAEIKERQGKVEAAQIAFMKNEIAKANAAPKKIVCPQCGGIAWMSPTEEWCDNCSYYSYDEVYRWSKEKEIEAIESGFDTDD